MRGVYRGWSGVVCVVFMSFGCVASDPVTFGGDCNPYACDCGLAEVGSGSPATCVGSPLCNVDEECPDEPGGAVEPVCRSNGDFVQNGFAGTCVLPCSQACPGEMECMQGRCVFLLDE